MDSVRLVMYEGCSLWNHQCDIFLEQFSVLTKDYQENPEVALEQLQLPICTCIAKSVYWSFLKLSKLLHRTTKHSYLYILSLYIQVLGLKRCNALP